MQEERLMTVQEVAGVLNIKVSRVRQAVFRREIGCVKIGALVRFREEDVRLYIERNLRTPAGA